MTSVFDEVSRDPEWEERARTMRMLAKLTGWKLYAETTEMWSYVCSHDGACQVCRTHTKFSVMEIRSAPDEVAYFCAPGASGVLACFAYLQQEGYLDVSG